MATIKFSIDEVLVVMHSINVVHSGGILMVLTILTMVFQNIAYGNLVGMLGNAGYPPMEIRATIGGGASSIILETAPSCS